MKQMNMSMCTKGTENSVYHGFCHCNLIDWKKKSMLISSLFFRIRVAAATAASSIARAPSSRRLSVNKGAVSFLAY